MIRCILNWLYNAAGYIAAFFLVGIGLTIVVQLVCRFVGVTFDSTELAGFCMAATTFFGLAHTFREGAHVRITLTLDRLPPRLRRAFEVVNCLVAGAGVSFLAWYVVDLMLQSLRYNDVSPGLLAIPFWIPQAGVAAGEVLFAVALLDELCWILVGRNPSYDVDETPDATHAE